GATEHPWGEQAPPDDDKLAEKLAQAIQSQQQAIKDYGTAEEKAESLNRELNQLREIVSQLEKDIDALQKQLKTHCSDWLNGESTDWDAIIAKIQGQRTALRAFQKA